MRIAQSSIHSIGVEADAPCWAAQVTISLKRDLSPAATSGELEAGGVGEGAFGSRRRGCGPGLPPLGAKVTLF